MAGLAWPDPNIFTQGHYRFQYKRAWYRPTDLVVRKPVINPHAAMKPITGLVHVQFLKQNLLKMHDYLYSYLDAILLFTTAHDFSYML